jgi:SAM-dependent methyltransferase
MMRTREEWDSWYTKPDPWQYEGSAEDRVRTEILLSRIRNARFRHCLDVGCGEGALTQAISAHAEETIGVDISVKAVERARSRYPSLRFEQGDLLDVVRWPEFRGRPFDFIVASEVLYYLQSDEEREAAVDGLADLGVAQCVYYFSVLITEPSAQRRYFAHDEFLDLLSRRFNVIDTFASVARRPKSLDFALGFIRSAQAQKSLLEAYTLTRMPVQCRHVGCLAVKRDAPTGLGPVQ